LTEQKPNVVLLSSVLQYLEEPYELLGSIIKHKFSYIIFDITPFHNGNNDIITIQQVPETIYSADYPCWIFSLNKFIQFLDDEYQQLIDFKSLYFPALEKFSLFRFLFQIEGATMNIIDKVLSLPEFKEHPPVLVDIGASGELHKIWKNLAKYSICIAFDADSRDIEYTVNEKSHYKKLYVYNRILTSQLKENEETFYLTKSPYCSSLL
jgi:hypothetical protein